MLRFKHSGKLGDIIWSLPFVRSLGGGILFVAIDDHGRNLDEHGKPAPGLTMNDFASIQPFLLQQSYLIAVEKFSGEAVDYDLDQFRTNRGHLTFNLVDNYFYAFGQTPPDRIAYDPWLLTDAASPTQRKIIISRTERYLINTPLHNQFYDRLISRGLSAQGIFIGLPAEHAAFQSEFAIEMPLLPPSDIATIAAAVRDCDLWVGNENMIGAIAEGFKKTCVREIRKDREELNCVFDRANLFYI